MASRAYRVYWMCVRVCVCCTRVLSVWSQGFGALAVSLVGCSGCGVALLGRYPETPISLNEGIYRKLS